MDPFLIDNYSPFFSSVAACPISKEPLRLDEDVLTAPCGFKYSSGDLRVGLDYSKAWAKSQAGYEEYQRRWFLSTERRPAYHKSADENLADVYSTIAMAGNILDVAGWFGLVVKQASLNPETYVSVDALPCRWTSLEPYKSFRSHYAICEKLCRLPAHAEFLPIRSETMDVVHMRSCLDHLSNPLLALKEAFRVLKKDGRVVIGLSLEGAYEKRPEGFYDTFKAVVKRNRILRELYETLLDHHIFHPTLPTLTELIRNSGFTIAQKVWQRNYFNVLYLSATKSI